MDTRKRGRGEFGLNVNGGFKKSKPEMDSLSSGIGSKTKPCTKFFSMAGCPFGENCHFLHHFPGGYKAVAQMMNLAPPPAATAPQPVPHQHPIQNGSAPAPTQMLLKTKLCNRYITAEGCKFNDKCHFAHGEWELGKPIQSQNDPRPTGPPIPTHFQPARPEPHVTGPAASFGATATAKISVDASLAGAIIGKGGVNSKQICFQTGAKLSIRDHEMDPNLRNIELEGSFEQIKLASGMVRELIVSIGSATAPVPAPAPAPGRPFGGAGGPPPPRTNLKTKLCENFAKGSCTFGDRCHFAHGASELRRTGL